jgi:hypothetical protein
VVLRSFAPKSGEVRRVTVYPSDFGLKRMAEEARHGPLAAFGKTAGDAKTAKAKAKAKKKKKLEETTIPTSETYSDDSDDSDDFDSPSDSESDVSEDEEDANVVRERMRQYERDRMTYYYAICECDSAETASAVYAACDGLEFERSANKLDLRYVPDGQSFVGREIRDAAVSVPSDYEPPEFSVKALQQTNVKLSWDDDDPARKKAFARKLTEDKLKDEDFAAYMASASEESDDSEASDDVEETKKPAVPTDTVKKQKKGSNRLSETDAAAAKKAYLAKLLGGGDDADEPQGADDDDDAADDDEDDDDEDAGDSGDEGFKRATWGVGDGVGSQSRYGDKAARRRAGSGRGGGGDMQVTFHAGLEALGEKMRRRKEELSGAVKETVWEKRLREKAEKRGLNAKKKKNDGLDEPMGMNEPKIRLDDVDADRRGSSTPSGFDDPFFADGGDDVDFDDVASDDDDVIGERKTTREKDALVTKTKKASKRHLKRLADDDPQVAKERADLELLMMDDDAVLGHLGATTRAKPVDARDVDASTLGETRTSSAVSKKKSRKARLAEKKKLRGKDARRRESDDEDDEGFSRNEKTNVDVSDDRFKGLFESEKFALDPTDPRFRETKAAGFIAEERARRRSEKSRASLALEKKKKTRENGALSRKKREENLPVAETGDEKDASGAGDVALRAMVKGLKRKSEAAARASGGSKRR